MVWHALMVKAPSQPTIGRCRKLNFIPRGYGKMQCKRVIWDTIIGGAIDEWKSCSSDVVPLHKNPLGFALFSRDQEIGAPIAEGCVEFSVHFGNDLLNIGV